MLAEEFLRRCLDAIDTGAEINAVEIKGEDLVFRIAPLQRQRQFGFLRLAMERAIGIQEKILGQLLGQGRAALNDVSGDEILNPRARHADGIQSQMLAKAAILDGDKGIGDIGGKVGHLDRRCPVSVRAARSAVRDRPEW